MEKHSSEKLNTICKKIKTTFEKLNIARIILVLSFAVFSYCILHYLAYSDEPIIDVLKSKIDDSRGLWTLITAIITAPIAFIIWVFRDINSTQQIENQRKDINLKEFQKIAEWVSGLHLIEDEVTEKIANQTEQETTKKYTQQSENLSIPTFSKKDGAVGLQIAAIYNLLPFYRGEHGESFKKPALNLLLSAWLALQQKEVKILESLDIWADSEKFETTVDKIKKNGQSPIGIAITQVLLADGGKNLAQYPEVFPNLCLAGMDFHLPGLDKNVLSLFINIKGKDCSGINLIGVNLNKSHLDGANLEKAILNGAILNGTSLNGTSLNGTSLNGASLNDASLNDASLNEASLEWASLNGASLNEASLNEASLNEASLNEASLNGASLNGASLNGASLNGASLNGASLNGASLNEASLNEASLEGARLDGASLERARLDGARLGGARLDGARLEGASLAGAIFTYDTNNINWADLKSKGGVILYFTESERKDYIHMQLAKGENTFNHIVPDNINIEKTQQENPDWEISIIK
ncbi:pentapeptide repeat-containing protein [Pasteurella multocida]|nr:pentapeptide repeat-containing protein [Pasteurella multocida]MDY0633340.1 pentapeptide repeat-containing protein [Pasteurella multocida]MDY0691429.1 pentapeptide repeat-containing protein [Pasteurella multocida]